MAQKRERPRRGSTPGAPTTANGSAAWVIERSAAAGGRPASLGRVAQAGNGNSTHSGTGISGWLTNIVPGLASRARWRCAGGRKPYSGRAGLGRVEPADDPDRRVGDDPPLHLAGGLLGADQDDARASGRARRCRAAPP